MLSPCPNSYSVKTNRLVLASLWMYVMYANLEHFEEIILIFYHGSIVTLLVYLL